MISIIILAFLACAIVLFVVLQFWSRYVRRDGLTKTAQLTSFDLTAFENLTDPEEDAYLKRNLSGAEFRRAQRLRIRVAKMYVAVLSKNASTLVAVGQAARSDPNAEMAASGQEIFERALRVKVWCLLTAIRLNAGLAFPTLHSPSSAIASHYITARQMAASLPRRSAA